jgi:hypothetical protein
MSKVRGTGRQAGEGGSAALQLIEPDVDKAITLMASTLAELKGQDDE